MNLAAKKLGFPKNAPEKPCVCSNARDGVFIERPAQSRNGLFPAVAPGDELDRKSTRLNSSHGYISYAVFCLKKKNTHSYSTRPSCRHDMRTCQRSSHLTYHP